LVPVALVVAVAIWLLTVYGTLWPWEPIEAY
jgi:hypothetical protein